MKILCEYTPAGPHYVRAGWGRVFAACGHEFKFWVMDTKSAFDAFYEYEPNVFFGCTYSIDRATAKCIAARPKMKVALFASANGPLVETIDRKRYPIVVASEQEKETIRRLKVETGKPDFVFIHVTDRFLEETMGGWREVGVEPIGVLNAADTFVYTGGTFRPELACDVGFVGGYWGYKARNLDSYLGPILHPDSGLRCKVFGNARWPFPCYMGPTSDEDVRDLFASATVCPNVSEPHSTDLGFDVIERIYKVLAAGGAMCISDDVLEVHSLFEPDELMTADSPKDFERKVRHFVSNPEQRLTFIKKGQAKVLARHTYFDRVAQFLNQFQMPAEARRVMEVKNSLLFADKTPSEDRPKCSVPTPN